jgi:3-isopropylmalate/(R)-2-methylmalate dehydratase large subunit
MTDTQKAAERIYIFDTTLRDGQQSPGAGMSFEDNLQYAEFAHQLKIDILEAGFPAAAKTDFAIVHAISQKMADIKSDMRIAGLCQLREEQCIKTMEALAPSQKIGKARVHTYVPVDPNLMQASLGAMANQPQQIIDTLYNIINMATREGYEVEFSPEGYSRMQHHFDFTLDLIRAAVAAGARIINCPDTIGGASKHEGEDYFVKKMQTHADIIKQEFPEEHIIWSAHCHNDFGLALENTMNAVFEGPARQIEGCINGIGERAGNVALEQCIMYIKHFGDKVNEHQKFFTGINHIFLQKISDFIAENMLPRQPHSPIVGVNAAKHTAGGHTNAILKNPLVYQPFNPNDIGNEISFAFGPLSGSNHAKQIIERHGYSCDAHEKVEITQYIKDYYHDRRKGITDQELIIAYLDYRKRDRKNIIDKIWEHHTVVQKPGHPAIIGIDLMLLHEVTSAQAFQMLKERKLSVYKPERCIATVDHSVPTRKDRHIFYDTSAKNQVERLRDDTKQYGITLYDFDSQHQGIVHIIGPELGATQPGLTIICGDSHTSTHGAFGALAFGVGSSEIGHALASGCLLLDKPKTMKVNFKGSLKKGVYSKDMIMKLIAHIGIGGANGHIIEYAGEAIRNMSMEERMTICNMSIECGARAGLIEPDETTFAYVKSRPYAPKGETWDKAVAYWKSLASDLNAHYDKEITIDVDALTPMVSWGTNPAQAIEINQCIPKSTDKNALDYVGLNEGDPIANTLIDWAFVGSCTNARIEDMRIVAKILDGKKVNPKVIFYIVPGSEAVLKQIEQEGLDKIFESAGAIFRMPGCSLCIGMNDDKVPSGKRCISSSNRNFVGRQGPGSRTHLASPATVAASALAGKIVSPIDYL